MSKSRYPWDQWFDGGTHVLRRGQDFEITTGQMYKQVICRAYDRKLLVDMRRGYDVLVVRARPKLELPANDTDSLQGGEAATHVPVKHAIDGSNPSPAAEVA